MARPWIDDEVWQQLDPRAGRLSRRQRGHVLAATLVTIAIVTLVVVARQSGVLWPRLSLGDWSGSADQSRHTFTETVSVRDVGWQGVRLTGVGTDNAGVRISGTTGLPAHVPSGGSASFTVRFDTVNCSHAYTGSVALLIRVSRWWGTATVSLTPQPVDPNGLAHLSCPGP